MQNKFTWTPSYSNQEIEVKTQKLGYQGFYQVSQIVLRHKKFSGEWSRWLDREQILRANSVAALLLDPKREVVVMVEQFRLGALRHKEAKSPWLLEVVAGYLEPDESPEGAIKREILEETYCTSLDLLPICQYFTTPGGFQEHTTIFCSIIDSSQAEDYAGSEDEDEDIKIHIIPVESVLKYLHNGLLTSSSTVIALQWLESNINNLLVNYKNVE